MITPVTLKESICRRVEENGASVVEIVERGSSGQPLLEVFVDNEEGITIDDCRNLSRQIQAVLDESGRPGYRLVVSSPGLDRPLRFPWQYRKHVGRQIAVVLRRGEGTMKVAGTLRTAEQAAIVVEDKHGKDQHRIPYDEIETATVELPW